MSADSSVVEILIVTGLVAGAAAAVILHTVRSLRARKGGSCGHACGGCGDGDSHGAAHGAGGKPKPPADRHPAPGA